MVVTSIENVLDFICDFNAVVGVHKHPINQKAVALNLGMKKHSFLPDCSRMKRVVIRSIKFSSFSTPIVALSAEKCEVVVYRKMPCRHSSKVTPLPAKQAFTTNSPQRKR